MASADRATPVRQSRTVPNISKNNALTPYSELPGTPWPRDRPVGKIAELATMPPAVNSVALFRNDRLPRVAIFFPPSKEFPAGQSRHVRAPTTLSACAPDSMTAAVE